MSFKPLRIAALALPLALASCATSEMDDVSNGNGMAMVPSRLESVAANGMLRCGVSTGLPGFSATSPEGDTTGIDADICRAIAAVVLDDPEKIEFIPLTASQRFTALRSGEIDILSRNTTNTLSRDSAGGNGLTFAPVVFYDGQGILVRTDSGIAALNDLSGKSFCVNTGTTTERNLNDVMLAANIPYEAITYQTKSEVSQAYQEGRCDAITSDKSGLAAIRSGFTDPEAHVILEDTLSKEPLAPATLEGDAQWGDAVRWIIYGLITAEERGITQANIEDEVAAATADTSNAALRRFLGIEGELGSKLGLPDDFVVRAIKAVGNYGELYDRHLGPDTTVSIPRGYNANYLDGGLQYAPPFN